MSGYEQGWKDGMAEATAILRPENTRLRVYAGVLWQLIGELRDHNARYMSEDWDGDDLSTEFAIALDRAMARLREADQ